MKFTSINAKLLFIITVAFGLSCLCVTLLADYYLVKTIDRTQSQLYSQEVTGILRQLERTDLELQDTLLVEQYEVHFKELVLETLRSRYYVDQKLAAFPFIIDSRGTVVMHPLMDAGHEYAPLPEHIVRIAELKKGSLEYTHNDTESWVIFDYFEKWDWIVGFTLPLHIKYADTKKILSVLVAIMVTITFFALLLVYIAVSYFTRPITLLTTAAAEMARGNLDLQIDDKGSGEIRTLTQSFVYMANSIKEKIDFLNEKNTDLQTEIEERHRVEESLRESRERFHALHNASFGGIAIHDKGVILDCNQGLPDITGFAMEELLGMNGLELIAPDWRELVMQRILSGYEKSYEVKGLRKDGTEYPVRVHGKNIPYKGITARVTEFRDITETKRLQDQLVQAQKMEAVGILAGGIAHDFNNILGAILGYAELAQTYSAENPKLKKYIDQVCLASDRAKRLVRQILAFSRQDRPEKIPGDIGVVIKESLQLLRASIPSTIAMRQNVKSNLGPVDADPTQIVQIVMNLCTNAFHAMEEDGGQLDIDLIPLEISTGSAINNQDIKPGRYLELIVKDTGPGMDTDTMSRIFEPYFTTKTVEKGTGMGLATVHGIVKNHGGFIKVFSEPGAGTSFHILFPLIENGAEKTIDAPDSAPGGHETILFVDDEAFLVDIAKESLEGLGYQVEATTNPCDALESFRVQPDKYDLIITDMTMPKMTGEKLAEEIKKIRPEIPIILCTGFSQRITPDNALELGIRKIVTKPFTIYDLATALRTVLDEDP